MNLLQFISIVGISMLSSLACICVKKSVASKQPIIKLLISSKMLYCGGLLYLLSALGTIWILKSIDYSIFMPATSITYVFTLLFATILLKECVRIRDIVGILLICLGVAFLAS